MSSTTSWYLIVALIGASAAVTLVYLAESAGRALGFVDLPRRGELQRYKLPRTGGYGVFAACWLAILTSFLIQPTAVERHRLDCTIVLDLRRFDGHCHDAATRPQPTNLASLAGATRASRSLGAGP